MHHLNSLIITDILRGFIRTYLHRRLYHIQLSHEVYEEVLDIGGIHGTTTDNDVL